MSHNGSLIAVQLRARRNLPPSGRGTDEWAADALLERQQLSLGANHLTCGQRLGRRDAGVWPDLLAQVPRTRWTPIEREQIGSLHENIRWDGGGGAAHCDVWFITLQQLSAPQPPPQRPYASPQVAPQPTLVELRASLEPQYDDFGCGDCAPAPV